jgi:AcrR family transcriptional regulator
MTRAPPRPKRGTPDETRRRLVAAAAATFNKVGFDGTDSNRIARAAGYAPGTFYKHFDDKRAIFVAVYREWVASEWRDIRAAVAAGGSRRARAERIVDAFVAYHRKWRGFRASLRAVVATDAAVRAQYREQRRLQLEMLVDLDGGARRRSREDDALLLFTTERAADALADGEAAALELDADALRAHLVAVVAARLA